MQIHSVSFYLYLSVLLWVNRILFVPFLFFVRFSTSFFILKMLLPFFLPFSSFQNIHWVQKLSLNALIIFHLKNDWCGGEKYDLAMKGELLQQNDASHKVKDNAVPIHDPPLFQGLHHRYTLTSNYPAMVAWK